MLRSCVNRVFGFNSRLRCSVMYAVACLASALPLFAYEIYVGIFSRVFMPTQAMSFVVQRHTAFSRSIEDIVAICAYPKVIWIDAFWVIATMANIKTIWNRFFVVSNPAKAMSEPDFFVESDLTVAGMVKKGGPFPAAIVSFDDARHQPLNWVVRLVQMSGWSKFLPQPFLPAMSWAKAQTVVLGCAAWKGA